MRSFTISFALNDYEANSSFIEITERFIGGIEGSFIPNGSI